MKHFSLNYIDYDNTYIGMNLIELQYLQCKQTRVDHPAEPSLKPKESLHGPRGCGQLAVKLCLHNALRKEKHREHANQRKKMNIE